MFKSLPIEIYHKLINYGIYEPPHFVAYKTAVIRPIFSCELNSNLSDNQKLILLTDEEMELNAEWEAFNNGDYDPMFYLQNQDLFTNYQPPIQYPS